MSTLPSRWREILRREAAENVGTVLAQAQSQTAPRRMPRWTVPALVVGAASVPLLSLIGGTEATGRGSVPFDRSTVISTRTVGLGASAEDLAPRPPPPALPTPEAAVTPPPRLDRPRPAVHRSTPPPQRPACPECEQRRLAAMLAPDLSPTPEPSPSPTPTPDPLVVNVGSRFEAALSYPVVTGAVMAPATAKLAKDIYVDGQLAIPEGARLVGEAFATQEDNRAQIVFTAMVIDGKTLPFQGWALQDGEMGVRAKVIRKGSKVKRGGSSVLGAAASALTYGLGAAASGPEGAALASLGTSAANDLFGLGREWRRSDKVVRVEAGVAVTVYLRRDLVLK